MHGEPLPYLGAQEGFAEFKDSPHREGKHEEVDVPVPHGQVLLADGDDLACLLRGPDGEMRESETGAVEDVGEAPDLIFLFLQQRL